LPIIISTGTGWEQNVFKIRGRPLVYIVIYNFDNIGLNKSFFLSDDAMDAAGLYTVLICGQL